MNVYLDDNRMDRALLGLLRKAGHTVVSLQDAALPGQTDSRHLEYAARHGLLVLTADRVDFWDLLNLIVTCGGTHPGILVVRFDNDRTRDMKPKHVVAALGKVVRSGISIVTQVVVLNAWQ